jgi:hypothetical protein
MRTIKTRVLVVVFMLGTLLNYGNSKNFNEALNAKSVKIVFKDAKKGQKLTIKDHNGVVLHSEKVTKQGELVKTFDFSELKDGNYSLELEKDFEIIVKSVLVKNNKVVFNEASKRIIFKPVVRNEENKLMISKIAFDKQSLKVALYYNNEIIYSETVEGDSIINRVYKLDEQKKGDYSVVLYNNGRRYINEFKI